MPTRLVTTTATEVLVRDSQRKSLLLVNGDPTDSIFLKQERSEGNTVTTTDHDVRIGPGAGFALGTLTDGKSQIMGRWTAISSANSPRLTIFESRDSDG